MDIGWYLTVVDRISGYALGTLQRLWRWPNECTCTCMRPSLIVRSAVAYFEELLNKETEMVKPVLKILSNEMRKNFFDTVLSFMRIRQRRVQFKILIAHTRISDYTNNRMYVN